MKKINFPKNTLENIFLDMNALQTGLKNAYLSNGLYDKIPLLAFSSTYFSFEDDYVIPTLKRNQKHKIENKTLKKNKIFFERLVSVEEIFEDWNFFSELSKQTKRILVMGVSGSGKSIFFQHIVYQWINNEASAWSTHYRWLFSIRPRELEGAICLKSGNMTEHIIHFLEKNYFNNIAINNKKLLISNILNDQKNTTLWLLDGYDELNFDIPCVQEFLNFITYIDRHFLITIRPKDEEISKINFNLELEILNFKDQQINQYVNSFFNQFKKNKSEDEQLKIEKKLHNALNQIETNPSVYALARIPLQLELLCSYFYLTDKLPDKFITLSQLYSVIVQMLLFQYVKYKSDCQNCHKINWSNWEHFGSKKYKDKYEIHLDYIKKLAFYSMQVNSSFIKEISEVNPELDQLKFKWIEKNNSDAELFDDIIKKMKFIKFIAGDNGVEFLHKTFKEFFVAQYIYEQFSYNEDSEQFKSILIFIDEQKFNPIYIDIFKFLAGLISSTPGALPIVFQRYWKLVLAPLFSTPMDRPQLSFLFNSLNEMIKERKIDRRIEHFHKNCMLQITNLLKLDCQTQNILLPVLAECGNLIFLFWEDIKDLPFVTNGYLKTFLYYAHHSVSSEWLPLFMEWIKSSKDQARYVAWHLLPHLVDEIEPKLLNEWITHALRKDESEWVKDIVIKILPYLIKKIELEQIAVWIDTIILPNTKSVYENQDSKNKEITSEQCLTCIEQKFKSKSSSAKQILIHVLSEITKELSMQQLKEWLPYLAKWLSNLMEDKNYIIKVVTLKVLPDFNGKFTSVQLTQWLSIGLQNKNIIVKTAARDIFKSFSDIFEFDRLKKFLGNEVLLQSENTCEAIIEVKKSNSYLNIDIPRSLHNDIQLVKDMYVIEAIAIVSLCNTINIEHTDGVQINSKNYKEFSKENTVKDNKIKCTDKGCSLKNKRQESPSHIYPILINEVSVSSTCHLDGLLPFLIRTTSNFVNAITQPIKSENLPEANVLIKNYNSAQSTILCDKTDFSHRIDPLSGHSVFEYRFSYKEKEIASVKLYGNFKPCSEENGTRNNILDTTGLFAGRDNHYFNETCSILPRSNTEIMFNGIRNGVPLGVMGGVANLLSDGLKKQNYGQISALIVQQGVFYGSYFLYRTVQISQQHSSQTVYSIVLQAATDTAGMFFTSAMLTQASKVLKCSEKKLNQAGWSMGGKIVYTVSLAVPYAAYAYDGVKAWLVSPIPAKTVKELALTTISVIASSYVTQCLVKNTGSILSFVGIFKRTSQRIIQPTKFISNKYKNK